VGMAKHFLKHAGSVTVKSMGFKYVIVIEPYRYTRILKIVARLQFIRFTLLPTSLKGKTS
jgi:hypothetical protein